MLLGKECFHQRMLSSKNVLIQKLRFAKKHFFQRGNFDFFLEETSILKMLIFEGEVAAFWENDFALKLRRLIHEECGSKIC